MSRYNQIDDNWKDGRIITDKNIQKLKLVSQNN